MNTQITEEEYITELLTNLPPKSWDDICEEEEEFIRICEEEEERERLEDLEEAEFLRIVEEEEDREREEEEEDLVRRHEDLERKRHEDLQREREERELKELAVVRKALLADGKYVLEEGEILE